MPRRPASPSDLRHDIHDRVTRVETSMEALTDKVGDIATNLGTLAGLVRDQAVNTTKMFQDQTAILNRQTADQTSILNKQFSDMALAVQQAQAPRRTDWIALTVAACAVFSLVIVIGGLVLVPMAHEDERNETATRDNANSIQSINNRVLTIENIAASAKAEAYDDNLRIRSLENDGSAQHEKNTEIETQIAWMTDMHNSFRRQQEQWDAVLFQKVFKQSLPEVSAFSEGPKSRSKE